MGGSRLAKPVPSAALGPQRPCGTVPSNLSNVDHSTLQAKGFFLLAPTCAMLLPGYSVRSPQAQEWPRSFSAGPGPEGRPASKGYISVVLIRITI